MSYKTNRRTGGIFRSDSDITGGRYQGRFVCPTCAAMLGQDLSPEEAEFEAKRRGREIAGTNLSTFPTRAELDAHRQIVHASGQRYPTKKHRQLGRIAPPAKERQEVETVESTQGSDILGSTNSSDDDSDIVGDVDESGDILGEEDEKEEIFGSEEGRGDKGLLDE